MPPGLRDCPTDALTAEAHCDRPCSPPPKQIVLLNPSASYGARRFGLGGTATLRSLVIVILLALAAWHLYATLDIAGAIHVSPQVMQP